MKTSVRRIAVLVTMGAVGVGAVGAVAASGAEETEMRPASAQALSITGTPVAVPAGVARGITDDLERAYGLDLNAARRFPAPDGKGDWIVIPGSNGACVAFPDSSGACSDAEGLAEGHLISESLPANPDFVVPNRSGPLSREDAVGSGPSTIRGLVPDGVITVVARNLANGRSVRAAVQNNGFQIVAKTGTQPPSFELIMADGTIKTFPIE